MVPEGTFATESERVALTFFLVIATVVFLFMVSYYLRMELPDWEPLSEPAQLWFNTGLLIASSVLFQWSRNIVVRGHTETYTHHFRCGCSGNPFHCGPNGHLESFTGGRILPDLKPAIAFYYLLTGLHAFLVGGCGFGVSAQYA